MQLDKMIRDRPLGWEYLVFAGALIVEMDAFDARYRDYAIGYAPRLGVPVYEESFMKFYEMQLVELLNISELFKQVYSNQAVDKAIGPGGASGDPTRILHLAKRYISVYDELLGWTERLRGTPVPRKYQQLVNIMSRYSEQPISEIRRFVNDYADQVKGIPESMKTGKHMMLQVPVKFEVPSELSRELKAERTRLEDLS